MSERQPGSTILRDNLFLCDKKCQSVQYNTNPPTTFTMGMTGRSGPPPDAAMDFKTGNKQRRKLMHIKRKRAKDAARRDERYGFKKQEAKNPKLREERLRRNVPLTLDRKRVWDEADSDAEEDGLGLAVDVERIKRAKKEEEDELNRPLEEGEDDSEAEESDAESIDSMIASSDGEDSDEDEDEKEDSSRGRKKSSLPSATERATSPTASARSTNLSLAPEALAAKFPTLFSDETPPTPENPHHYLAQLEPPRTSRCLDRSVPQQRVHPSLSTPPFAQVLNP